MNSDYLKSVPRICTFNMNVTDTIYEIPQALSVRTVLWTFIKTIVAKKGKKKRKHLFPDVPQNRCSVLGSLFNEVTGL